MSSMSSAVTTATFSATLATDFRLLVEEKTSSSSSLKYRERKLFSSSEAAPAVVAGGTRNRSRHVIAVNALGDMKTSRQSHANCMPLPAAIPSTLPWTLSADNHDQPP